MSRDIWSPEQYGRYADERSRPFFELVERVNAQDPARVVDLGCGSGELTTALAQRWPGADVVGLDSSSAMIARARKSAEARDSAAERGSAHGRGPALGRLRFAVGDLREWEADSPVDVLVSNAALQWVPEHRDLLRHWVTRVAPGGWLAFQVPGNFDAPSHRVVREVCLLPRWAARVECGLVGAMRPDPVGEPVDYVDLLAGQGCRVDAWETTYLYLLTGSDPVLEWIKGTALRPVLDLLTGDERDEFLADTAMRLRERYPPRPYGTVFPFRRIFVVAQR